jgi:magnesium-transporting ATPase (P-type)
MKTLAAAIWFLTKGAPDVVLARSRQMLLKDQERPLTTLLVEEIQNQNALLAQKALRVLAIATNDYRHYRQTWTWKSWSTILPFLGWQGLWTRCDRKPNRLYKNAASRPSHHHDYR